MVLCQSTPAKKQLRWSCGDSLHTSALPTGKSHFPYLLGYQLLKSASNQNYWCINFSTSRRVWQSICVIEGDCYGLPTCACLLDTAETFNTGKAEPGVKIQKYLGQSSKCTSLWLLCHTVDFSVCLCCWRASSIQRCRVFRDALHRVFLIKPAPVSTHSNCIYFGRCGLNSLSRGGEWKHETFG